jgi:hypothetical protein
MTLRLRWRLRRATFEFGPVLFFFLKFSVFLRRYLFLWNSEKKNSVI